MFQGPSGASPFLKSSSDLPNSFGLLVGPSPPANKTCSMGFGCLLGLSLLANGVLFISFGLVLLSSLAGNNVLPINFGFLLGPSLPANKVLPISFIFLPDIFVAGEVSSVSECACFIAGAFPPERNWSMNAGDEVRSYGTVGAFSVGLSGDCSNESDLS